MPNGREERVGPKASRNPNDRLSYKFQRLREQIRSSVLNGEFTQRLPGERELGRKYKANAKTINKALCDLSSEGLLVRYIGRGTFLTAPDGGSGRRAHRQCVGLLPAIADDNPQYRRILLDAFRERMAQRGQIVEFCRFATEDDRHCIPLRAWSPTTRSSTSALISYPRDPLCGGIGRLGEDCVAEAYRRHIPIISLAGFAGAVKTHAVVPDYVDAGFRLTEHLALLGCREIVVLREDQGERENELVMNGCRTAAARHHLSLVALPLPAEGSASGFDDRQLTRTIVSPSRPKGDPLHPIGLVCIGNSCLRAVLTRLSLGGTSVLDECAVACLLEPGDLAARDAGLTAYEVDPRRIGVLGANLVGELRPGQTPVEMIIPGELRIRGSTQSRPRAGAEVIPVRDIHDISSTEAGLSEAMV